MTVKRAILLLLLLSIFGITKSQINQGGYPYTYADSSMHLFEEVKLKSGSEKGSYSIPSVVNEDELEYANSLKENCPSCRNDIYGKGLNININFKEQAKKVSSKNGINVWVLKFQSNEAFGLQFVFSDFQIPEAAKLFFYNEDRSFLLGAFTSENNTLDRKFSTQYVKGSTIYMEYVETANPEFEGSLILSEVVHVFKNVFTRSGPFSQGDAAWCENDAMCQSEIWDKEIRTVALILHKVNDNYYGFGSGALIRKADEYQDSESPYLLTASHINRDYGETEWLGDDKINDWIFLFNYQSVSCDDDNINDSPEAIQEMMTQSVRGAEVISRDIGETNIEQSDYLLLKFKGGNTVGNLKQYRVCYAGWEKFDDYLNLNSQFVGIHHPLGNPKKISFSDNIFSSDFQELGIYNYDFWGTIWNSGITEGGSSGSPLFNNQGRIIGHLAGGYSYCEDTPVGGPGFPDNYGKFSTSFNAGGFRQYLDPYSKYDYVNTYEPEGTPPPCNGNGYCDPGETLTCGDCLPTDPGGCRLTIGDGGFIINNSLEGLAYSCAPHYLYFDKDDCARYFPLVERSFKCGLFNLFTCYQILPGFDITIYDCDENLNCSNGTTKSFWGHYGHYSYGSADQVDLSEVGKTFTPGNYYAVKISGTYGQTNSFQPLEYQESIRYIQIMPEIDDITITNSLPAILKIINISTRKTITLSDFTFGKDLVYIAGQSITIKPGTLIPNGRNVSLKINPNFNSACNPTTKSAIVNNKTQTTQANGIALLKFHNKEINNKVNIKDIEDSQVQKGINIYPNPSSSVLNFSINKNEQVHQIEIFNTNGTKVKEIDCIDSDLLTIDISNLNSGIHFIQIITDNGLIVKKFIKQ